MTEPQAKGWFVMGLVCRGDFRRACQRMDLSYTEDKGWIDSQFIVTGPKSKIDFLLAEVKRLNEEAV